VQCSCISTEFHHNASPIRDCAHNVCVQVKIKLGSLSRTSLIAYSVFTLTFKWIVPRDRKLCSWWRL